MTPSEHYREAERILADINENKEKLSAPGAITLLLALAQVHATLAAVQDYQPEIVATRMFR